jgi:hypothetical protein
MAQLFVLYSPYWRRRFELCHYGGVKRKAEYVEGPEASSNFERAMRGLFSIPKSETPERPKREKKRKKINGKGRVGQIG